MKTWMVFNSHKTSKPLKPEETEATETMQESQHKCECMKRSITGGSAFSVGRALYKCKIDDKNRTKQDRDTMDHFIMERIGNHTLPTNAMPTNDPLFHYQAKHSSFIHHVIFFKSQTLHLWLVHSKWQCLIAVNQNSSYLCSLSSLTIVVWFTHL